MVFADSIEPLSQQPSNRVCCIKDQVVTDCYNSCSEYTCENLKKNGTQICLHLCQPDVCVCKEGLYRNECNECVTEAQCIALCTKNEPMQCSNQFEIVYGCFDPATAHVCPYVGFSRLRDVFFALISPNPTRTKLCVPNVCDCIDGYLRNVCGQCVLPEDCPKNCIRNTCEGENEIPLYSNKIYCNCDYSTCQRIYTENRRCDRNGRCHRQNNICDGYCQCMCSRNRHRTCFPPPPTAVCKCRSGYDRNVCSRCVPIDQVNDDLPCACTNPCRTDLNFQWQCYNDCNAPTCKNFFELQSKKCVASCNYGCYCDANKQLWNNGTACVPSSSCVA